MDWDIDVPGVTQVLTDTVTEAEPFDGLAKTYGTSLQAIADGLNYDVFTVVAAALGEYATLGRRPWKRRRSRSVPR